MKIARLYLYFLLGFFWALISISAWAQMSPLKFEVVGGGVGANVSVGMSTRADGVLWTCNPKVVGDCNTQAVRTKINPKEPMVTPSGWYPAVSPSIEPRAPNTSTYAAPSGTAMISNVGWNICSASVVEAPFVFSQSPQYLRWIKQDVNGSGYPPPDGSGTWTAAGIPQCSPGRLEFYKSLPQCGTGYTLSSGSCVATAGAVPKPSDGVCDIKRTGNTFANDSNDPDCAAVPGLSVSGGTLNIIPNAAKPYRGTMTTNGTTGTSQVVITSTNSSSNTTTITTYNLSAPDATTGVVTITGISTATYSGTGDAVGTTPIGTDGTGTGTGSTESTLASAKAVLDAIKAGQCGGADQPKCKTESESTFGGTCGAFTCGGDAIQCAIASEQHKRNCELFTDDAATRLVGEKMIAGDDPLKSTFPNDPANVVTTGVGSISSSTFLTAAAGLSDQTIPVGVHSFVIPWSKWNDVLGYMGLIVMAFAFIAGYKIIGVH